MPTTDFIAIKQLLATLREIISAAIADQDLHNSILVTRLTSYDQALEQQAKLIAKGELKCAQGSAESLQLLNIIEAAATQLLTDIHELLGEVKLYGESVLETTSWC